ncbi:MAG: DUF5615 family PIN-like protein, partial [Chthoniobacteraceae bacterium]
NSRPRSRGCSATSGRRQSRCATSRCAKPTTTPSVQYALEHDTGIVTKDEDFPERSLCSPAPPQILWLRIANCSNRALFDWFHPLWPDIERRPLAGDRIVEVS